MCKAHQAFKRCLHRSSRRTVRRELFLVRTRRLDAENASFTSSYLYRRSADPWEFD